MIMTRTKTVLLPFLVSCAVTGGGVIGATWSSTPDEPTAPPSQGASSSPDRKKLAVVPDPGTADEKTQGSSPSNPGPKAEAVGEPAPPSGGGPVEAAGMVGLMTGVMEGGFGGNAAAGVDPDLEFRHRLEIAQLAAALTTWEKNPKNEAILKALEEPIPMPFAKETTLDFVLKYIKKRAAEKPGRPPIPIYLDPKGLEQVERSLNSTVMIDLEGVPLKTSLRLLLKQLGLAYCVRDGVLIISSVVGVREELAEAARELLGNGNEEVDLELMQKMGIGPRGPMGGGGPAGGMGGGMRNTGARGGMMSIAPGSFDPR
jgi:hypothetical protein